MSRLEQPVNWQLSPDGCDPWIATVGSQRWEVRVNDFPKEPFLYTLLVDGKPEQDFTKWPACWARPPVESMARVHLFVLREFEQLQFEALLNAVKSAAQPPANPKKSMSVSELFAARKAENARDLEKAERQAALSGKEAFDLDRLRQIRQLPPGAPMRHEDTLRSRYYVSYPEVRTLADFARELADIEAWED